MFEDLIINDGEKENIENLNIKLYEEKSWIGLGWLHGAISRELYANSDGQINPSKVVADSEAIKHTLAYLKPLLERGELKTCGLETLHPNVDGKTSFREFTGTSDEILNQIRSLWLEARQKAEAEKNPAILAMFESFGVMFVTAEGMTRMKRTFLEK